MRAGRLFFFLLLLVDVATTTTSNNNHRSQSGLAHNELMMTVEEEEEFSFIASYSRVVRRTGNRIILNDGNFFCFRISRGRK
jgi:hypothetical protein